MVDKMKQVLALLYVLLWTPIPLQSLRPPSPPVINLRVVLTYYPSTALCGSQKNEEDMEYRNPVASFLSAFMETGGSTVEKEEDPLAAIDFAAPKITARLNLELLASILDAELYEREWFVTGNVNPIYFSDGFVFQDPDIRLEGIEAYARGVRRLFDQQSSRAEIISTEVSPTTPNTITCTWRLSGKAKIGPGLTIKPYIVRTDFTVDPTTGLIVLQEDRFDIPQWDILLSSLFPFLIGKVTAPPASPVAPRVVTMPTIPSNLQ